MIKAILFDLDRTLVNIDIPEQKALEYLHQNFIDPQISVSDFIASYKRENEKWWLLRSQEKAGLEDVRLNSFSDALKALHTSISISIEELSKHYIREAQKHWQVYPNVYSMLDSLKAEKIKTAIITNGFSSVQRVKLKALNLDHAFDFIAISDELSLTKPHKEIFEFTLSQLNIPKENSIYVGDNLDDDYQGSLNAEIQFLWFNEHGKENPKQIPEFSSYEGFLNKMGAFRFRDGVINP